MSVLFVIDTAAPADPPPPINVGGISQYSKQCQPMHVKCDSSGGREFASITYGISGGGELVFFLTRS